MHNYNPKRILLLNGNLINIRQANNGDIEKILICIRLYMSKSSQLPKYENSIDFNNKNYDLLLSFIENKNFLLIAEFNDKIVGHISFENNIRDKKKDSALIGLGILSEWEVTELYDLLLQEMLFIVKQNLQIEKVWVNFYADGKLKFLDLRS